MIKGYVSDGITTTVFPIAITGNTSRQQTQQRSFRRDRQLRRCRSVRSWRWKCFGRAGCAPRHRTCRPMLRRKKSARSEASTSLRACSAPTIAASRVNDLLLAKRQVFRHVIQHLGTIVRRCLAPADRFAGRLHCVANDPCDYRAALRQAIARPAQRTSKLYPESGRACLPPM